MHLFLEAYPNVAESPQSVLPITLLEVIQISTLGSCVHRHLYIAHVATDEVHLHMVSVVCCCSECRGPPGIIISVIVEDANKSCSCCGEQPGGIESMLSNNRYCSAPREGS